MMAWSGSIEVISLWENLYWSLSVHNEDTYFIAHLSDWLCPVDTVLHWCLLLSQSLKKIQLWIETTLIFYYRKCKLKHVSLAVKLYLYLWAYTCFYWPQGFILALLV